MMLGYPASPELEVVLGASTAGANPFKSEPFVDQALRALLLSSSRVVNRNMSIAHGIRKLGVIGAGQMGASYQCVQPDKS